MQIAGKVCIFHSRPYLWDAKIWVRQEQMKVLGNVAAVFWDFFLEKCQDRSKYVITDGQCRIQWWNDCIHQHNKYCWMHWLQSLICCIKSTKQLALKTTLKKHSTITCGFCLTRQLLQQLKLDPQKKTYLFTDSMSPNIHTHIHRFNGHFPGKLGLASCPPWLPIFNHSYPEHPCGTGWNCSSLLFEVGRRRLPAGYFGL